MPERYDVISQLGKEFVDLCCQRSDEQLVWVHGGVKDFFGSMDGVSDKSDVFDVFHGKGEFQTYAHGHDFGFSR